MQHDRCDGWIRLMVLVVKRNERTIKNIDQTEQELNANR